MVGEVMRLNHIGTVVPGKNIKESSYTAMLVTGARIPEPEAPPSEWTDTANVCLYSPLLGYLPPLYGYILSLEI
jgi:hypothetical protein